MISWVMWVVKVKTTPQVSGLGRITRGGPLIAKNAMSGAPGTRRAFV